MGGEGPAMCIIILVSFAMPCFFKVTNNLNKLCVLTLCHKFVCHLKGAGSQI